MHTMQQTHTHKAVTQQVEAKKFLSRRRQSEYSYIWTYQYGMSTQTDRKYACNEIFIEKYTWNWYRKCQNNKQ